MWSSLSLRTLKLVRPQMSLVEVWSNYLSPLLKIQRGAGDSANLLPHLRIAERFVLLECVQPLGELSSKFGEIARPNRLPHASHSVKEEGQIVVG